MFFGKNTMQQERIKAQRKVSGARSYQVGIDAEKLAKEELQRTGWTILLERAKTRRGEIDLVAYKGTLLCFFEVKKRKTTGEALACLLPAQQSRLYRAAECLLAAYPAWNFEEMRFDLIGFDENNTCIWLEDILRIT
ncbi:YraN family protein [Acetobacter orientalis]|uniref:YraN family protein n=1 Tax=Acetobacter orientalis TaxID=146474 RepID=UPI0039E94648